MDFLSESFLFDWKLTLIDFLRGANAFVLAIPLGWGRHESKRNLGFRILKKSGQFLARIFSARL
jgi:hypothetical protein